MPCMAGISIIYLLRACYEEMRTAPSDFGNGIPHGASLQEARQIPQEPKDNHSGKPRSKGMSLAILRKTRPIASNCHQIFSANSALEQGFRRTRGGRTLLRAAFDFAQRSDMKFRKPTKISLEPKTSKSRAQGTSRGSLALVISRLLFMRMFMQCRDPVKVY
jgi:hypothetical protein